VIGPPCARLVDEVLVNQQQILSNQNRLLAK
jgi:hypothetical protein